MAGNASIRRIRQDVADVSSADQLLRYALAGQLALLEERGYKQGEIAVGAGLGRGTRSAGSAISRALQNGPRAHLGKANDDEGGVRRVLNHAGSLLQTGDNGARKVLATERCAAGLSQHERERGFGKESLLAGLLRANPQNFAHVTAQSTCRAVDEVADSAHCFFG